MFQGPVASYSGHSVLSDAALNSRSRSQCVRFFLDLEPHGEAGWVGVQDVRTGPGWERGEAMEPTVSFASEVQTWVGR